MKVKKSNKLLAIMAICTAVLIAPATYAASQPAQVISSDHLIADQSSNQPVRPDRTRSGKLRTRIV